jgi:hypothetical protein
VPVEGAGSVADMAAVFVQVPATSSWRGLQRAGRALSHLDTRRGRGGRLCSALSTIAPVVQAVACRLYGIQAIKMAGQG